MKKSETKVAGAPKATATATVGKKKLDLKELQEKQLNGEEIEQATGNQDKSYQFPTHEGDRVHLKLTKQVNDPVKKQYVNEDKVVKLVPQQFERMEANGSFDEYDEVTILHDPRPAAVRNAAAEPAEPGEPKEPMQPISTLPTLQDAQMRYQQLYGAPAPASAEYHELVELINEKDGFTAEEKKELGI